MVDAATESVAQPSPMAHSTIQPWSTTMVHEMAMNAIIQKHSSAGSPAVTPTTKPLKSLCIPAVGSSAAASVLQPSYITVNPSGAGTSSLPLIAQGVPGGAQVLQGTPIAMSMSQLGELGTASVVQLAPIGYTSGGHGNDAGLLQ